MKNFTISFNKQFDLKASNTKLINADYFSK